MEEICKKPRMLIDQSKIHLAEPFLLDDIELVLREFAWSFEDLYYNEDSPAINVDVLVTPFEHTGYIDSIFAKYELVNFAK